MVGIMIKDIYCQVQKEVNLITHTRLNGLTKIRVNLSASGTEIWMSMNQAVLPGSRD